VSNFSLKFRGVFKHPKHPLVTALPITTVHHLHNGGNLTTWLRNGRKRTGVTVVDKNSHVNDRRVGDGNFRTSQNPTLNRSPKNLLQVITLAAPMSVPHLVQTRPWGLLGNEWNITIFYLYFFFGNSPTRQTRRRIFTLGGSNDADSRKGVLFGVWFILLAILEMKSSKTPNFFWGGGENRRFQAKQPKYWKFHTVNTTASISTKFCKK